MYVQCIYHVYTCIHYVCTWYNQLSQQVFVAYSTGTQWSTGKWTLHIHCIYFVYTCCRHVCTNHIQLCTLYIHVHVVDICNHVLPRWTQEQLKKVIAMLQDPAFDSKEIDPDLHKRMDKAAMCMRWTSGCGRSVSWKDWCPLMHRTIWMWAVPIQKMVIGLCQARCCRNRRGHQHWFNSFGIITGIYAYNTWYPCTVFVHVYTLYVHIYAMYVHVLISCLNSHS